MSKLRKIQKNAHQYEINQIYQNMTPEQYKEGIRIAVKNAVDDLSLKFDKQLQKLCDDYNKQINESVHITMDTFSIEFLYELGEKLECFKEEPEYLEQKIDLVQSIYENIMGCIKSYVDIKEDGKAYKEFERKRKKIKEVFGIFKD